MEKWIIYIVALVVLLATLGIIGGANASLTEEDPPQCNCRFDLGGELVYGIYNDSDCIQTNCLIEIG